MDINSLPVVESGLPVPAEPVLFLKANSAVMGCNDPVVLPKDSVKSDWEVELGVVIGTKARYVSEAEALNTRTMVFGVTHLVSYVSRFMTLYPGDIISTGTPSGVGMGVKPTPVFLKPGDKIRLGIAGLGDQSQTVHAWNPELVDG